MDGEDKIAETGENDFDYWMAELDRFIYQLLTDESGECRRIYIIAALKIMSERMRYKLLNASEIDPSTDTTK